jgi:hypothetical protein
VLTALQVEQQEQQQQQHLCAADTVSLMEQLASISRAHSSGAGSSSNAMFVEDQALQQLLPLVGTTGLRTFVCCCCCCFDCMRPDCWLSRSCSSRFCRLVCEMFLYIPTIICAGGAALLRRYATAACMWCRYNCTTGFC